MGWGPREACAAALNAAFVPPDEGWSLLEAVPFEHIPALLEPDKRRLFLAFDAAAEEKALAAAGARLLLRGDPEYPALLSEIHDPPLVLSVRGPLAAEGMVAFVGARFPTEYGRRQARRLAGDAARAGLCVVSGLARGLDAEAHKAALDAGGLTWAVLGSGLGRVYPPENRALAERIVAAGGAVMTEMSWSCAPAKELFPRRNRIVSGLSWATVVVEGRRASGTLITARLAAEQGRDLLAVPGPADSELSEAPHDLIRKGAALCLSLADLQAALPPEFRRPARPQPAAAVPEPEEAKILSLLGADSLSLEELSRLTGLDTPRISSIMFVLEVKELVRAVPGQRYAQKAR